MFSTQSDGFKIKVANEKMGAGALMCTNAAPSDNINCRARPYSASVTSVQKDGHGTSTTVLDSRHRGDALQAPAVKLHALF